VKTCPLGGKCQEVVGDEVHICEWFTRIQGAHPQTGENVDEEGCAIRLNLLVSLDSTKAQDRATNTLNEGAQFFKKVLTHATDNAAGRIRNGGAEHGPAAGHIASGSAD